MTWRAFPVVRCGVEPAEVSDSWHRAGSVPVGTEEEKEEEDGVCATQGNQPCARGLWPHHRFPKAVRHQAIMGHADWPRH